MRVDDLLLALALFLAFWWLLKSGCDEYEFRKMESARTIAREERERRSH